MFYTFTVFLNPQWQRSTSEPCVTEFLLYKMCNYHSLIDAKPIHNTLTILLTISKNSVTIKQCASLTLSLPCLSDIWNIYLCQTLHSLVVKGLNLHFATFRYSTHIWWFQWHQYFNADHTSSTANSIFKIPTNGSPHWHHANGIVWPWDCLRHSAILYYCSKMDFFRLCCKRSV